LEEYERKEARRTAVWAYNNALDEKEKDIIKLHLGLWGNRHHTFTKLGKKYGVCRERIRQIEAKSLKKLKKLLSLGYAERYYRRQR